MGSVALTGGDSIQRTLMTATALPDMAKAGSFQTRKIGFYQGNINTTNKSSDDGNTRLPSVSENTCPGLGQIFGMYYGEV